MKVSESLHRASEALIAVAASQRVDLRSICLSGSFVKSDRSIVFTDDYKEIRYTIQGSIRLLPAEYRSSANSFYGMWAESGMVEDMQQAFDLLKAWLLDFKEVDELPQRTVRRSGISGV